MRPSHPAGTRRLAPLRGGAGRAAVLSALGTAVAMWAMIPARAGSGAGGWMLWVGIAAAGFPIAWYLVDPDRPDAPRPWLVSLLGIELVLVQLARSPQRFTLFDELLHVRTLQDILATGRLGTPNSVLPISASFPGLETLTASISAATGLGWFASALIVVVVARLVMVAAVLAVARSVGFDRSTAALVGAVYLAHPDVLLHARFSSGTLALPLAVMLVAVLARRARELERPSLDAVVVLLAAATVVTDHVTSVLLIALLTAWTVAAAIRRQDVRHLAAATATVTVLLVAWWVRFAPEATEHLARATGSAVEGARDAVRGSGETRHPFEVGPATPRWERLVGVVGTVVQLAVIPFGVRAMWRFRHRGALLTVLIAGALVYPLSLGSRLLGDAGGIVVAAAPVLYLGVAVAIASVIGAWTGRRSGWSQRLAAATVIVLVLVANGLVGTSPTTRLPGPDAPAAGTRSIDVATVEAAEWLAEHRGPGHRIVADRTNSIAMAAYGRQSPITDPDDDAMVGPIFLAPEMDDDAIDRLRAARVSFVVVDLRGATAVTADGRSDDRIPFDRLAKFERAPGFDLVFDNGPIRIYDTGLTPAPTGPAEIVEPDRPVERSTARVVVGIVVVPLVLVGIGWLLIRRRRERGWPTVECLGLTLACSVAMVTTAGLVLGSTPFGIGPLSVPVALLLVAAAPAVPGRSWSGGTEVAPDLAVPRFASEIPATRGTVGRRRRASARRRARVVVATAVVASVLTATFQRVRSDAVSQDAPTTELGLDVVGDDLVVTVTRRRAEVRPVEVLVAVDGRTRADEVVVPDDGVSWFVTDLDGESSVTAVVEVDGVRREGVITIAGTTRIDAALRQAP